MKNSATRYGSRHCGMGSGGVWFGVMMLALSARVVAQAPDSARLRQVAAAAIGSWADQPPPAISVMARRLESYPAIKFYLGQAAGEHSMLSGLVADIPGFGLLPLGNAPVRRLLTEYVHVAMTDTADVVAYAVALAQLDGSIPPDAVVVHSRTDLPARLAGSERLGPFAPRIGTLSRHVRQVLFLVVSQDRFIFRASVYLHETRWDDTSSGEFMLEYRRE